MGTPNSTFSITPQPNNYYTGSATGILPTQKSNSNVLSGMTIPNQTTTQNTGLMQGNNPITSQVPTNTGMIPKDTTMTGVSTPPVVNVGGKSQVAKGSPSVVAQQKALNEANINTPGYVAIAEDGFYGDKTKAAFQQYGYNPQTGQPNTPKTTPTATSTSAPTSTDTNYSSSNPSTFPGLVNTQANVSGNAANTGSENYDTANKSLLGATAGNQQYQDNATAIANAAQQKISDIGGQGAKGMTGYLSTGTSPVAEGNAQLLQNSISQQQQAVTAGANMALSGNAQGLTGQAQQQAGYNQASGNALTSQGQGITGLNSAAGMAQPNATSQGQTTYNPLTNSFSGGSYSDNLNTVVNAIKSGNMGYTDGVNSLSSLSPTAKADVLKALGTGFDTVASDANASAKGTNITTGGTAATSAANAVYQKAYSDYQDLTQSVQNVDSFGSLLTTGMNDKQGNIINPTDSKWANQSISAVRNQLSSQQQAQFDSTYAALKSKVSGLLSIGGSEIPTQITSDANKILDGSAPYGTLNATLQRIQTEGTILLTSQAKKVNDALTQTKGGNTSTSTNTNGGTGAFSDSSFYGQQ